MIFYSHSKNNLQITNFKRLSHVKAKLNYNNLYNPPFPIRSCWPDTYR